MIIFLMLLWLHFLIIIELVLNSDGEPNWRAVGLKSVMFVFADFGLKIIFKH